MPDAAVMASVAPPDRPAVVSRRHQPLDVLSGVVEYDRFELHAQLIVGICADGIAGYELLLRLRDDGGELVSPCGFIYGAERHGLMGPVDRWVLGRAIELLHEAAETGHEISPFVNRSGQTMNDLALPRHLGYRLDRQPIPDDRLVVEVTETAAIVNIERASELARELRTLGCRFALDAFGAGFASFYYRKHLDFGYLKIEGDFITNITSNRTDRLVVQPGVDIAQRRVTRTVAEQIGDQDTIELLHDFGVHHGQGYHLSKPDAVTATLGRRSARQP